MKTKLIKTLAERHTTKELELITEQDQAAADSMYANYPTIHRIEILEGIARGEKDISEGRVLSHAQAKKKLNKWLS